MKRFELEPIATTAYLKEVLEETNSFSEDVLRVVDFNQGHFFTYLPVETSPKQVYEFKVGGIALGVRGFVRPHILKKLNETKDSLCIFDDYNAEYRPGYDEPFFLKYGRYLGSEVYYLLFHGTTSLEQFKTCCYRSEIIWHSLCIFSKTKLSKEPAHELQAQEREAICKNAELILISAYDGEGYVIWEKSNQY